MSRAEQWAKLPAHPTVRDPNPEVHRRIAERLDDGWRPDLTCVPPLWRRENGDTMVLYRRHEKALRAGHGDERPADQLSSPVDEPEPVTCQWPADGNPPVRGTASWAECGAPAVVEVTNGPAVHWLARRRICELHRHAAYRAGWHLLPEPELDSLDEVAPLPTVAEQLSFAQGLVADFAGYAASWPERTVKVMRAAAVVLQGGSVPDGLGIDPQRDGPSGLGRLLDDHAEAAEWLIAEHAQPGRPWWDLYGRLLVAVDAGLARLARWIDSCRPRPDRPS